MAFCFLVTKDLNKESIWRTWFSKLDELKFPYRVFTHCSNPAAITSEFLKSTLIGPEHTYPTAWGKVARAEWSLFKYAYSNAAADWHILLSESCVPIVTPKKFIETYAKHSRNSFISHCRAWWDVTKSNRADLYKLPEEYHLAHTTWIILCREDIEAIKSLETVETDLINNYIDTFIADESMIAVWLKKANNLVNVINETTTIVDWTRSNGNNPYTFNTIMPSDTILIKDHLDKNKYSMFLRKIGKSCPDDMILPYIIS